MKQVSVCEAAAIGLWLVGLALVLADVIFGSHEDGLGPVGVVLSVGAATLNVRAWMYQFSERERDAFEMGRDSVTQLRR